MSLVDIFVQFVKFCLVGGTGLGIQSVALWVLTRRLGIKDFRPTGVHILGRDLEIPWGLAFAVLCAVSFTFIFDKYWALT
jgi:putative flippase GtrA